MKNILIAFDGSEHAVKAIKEAKKLIKGFPTSKVTVLEVLDISKVKDQALDLSKSSEERKSTRINEVKDQLKGLLDDYLLTILIGDPATEIINYAKKEEYDLLIIGSRGLNLLQEFIMGSVSHKVVKHAQIPILVVK
ncbi:universal stress protein [Listeria monocytogenes]|uniref:Universal stress protein n=1 Tax=Listeria monocytogenes TaxID=1639 RepID=A0AAN3BCL5_LISMN|nr:universal stress protein [Listeria monocytogenes]EAC3367818.1 universal stress protein [Listeria monocytogenes]EAC7086919.1 universal stress protein [Listeria monocytogenes]EAC8542073.1 universal stress protein [Listeria monocytogenes]EAC8548075.1 universal stress protein [Listeria monocytogenes]